MLRQQIMLSLGPAYLLSLSAYNLKFLISVESYEWKHLIFIIIIKKLPCYSIRNHLKLFCN